MDDNNYFTLNMNNILDRHNVITNGGFEYWDFHITGLLLTTIHSKFNEKGGA